MIEILFKILLAPLILAFSLAGYSPSLNLGGFSPAGGITYRLQSSIGVSDASVKLSSFKNRSSIPLTMTLLNTDIGYGTLSPQTSRSEFVSFSGVTQNADGTATLTGVSRGLSDISPFTASTTLRQAHPGQSVFILSDSPQLFEEYAKRRNDETITGRWNFSTELPYSSITATTSNQFTNKSYVDSTANQGAATSTETNGGIVELGTLAEQADSYDGGANKPTVLQTKNSTSTCQVSGAYNLVASSTTGKLDKNCFDQTANYTFSGQNTFSATTTQSGYVKPNDTFGSWGGGYLPTGTMLSYASSTPPTGFLGCDGSAISRSTYGMLFSVVGTTYGVGDGSTTFNIPNAQGRNFLFASTTANMAQTGGESNHTLTTAEMPAHTHQVKTVPSGGGSTNGATTGGDTEASGSTGGGSAHNVLDPYIVTTCIIKT